MKLKNDLFLKISLIALTILSAHSVLAYEDYEGFSEEPTVEYQGEAQQEDLSYDRAFDDGGDFQSGASSFDASSGEIHSPVEPLYESDSYESGDDESYQDY